jgi:hypothetical protein
VALGGLATRPASDVRPAFDKLPPIHHIIAKDRLRDYRAGGFALMGATSAIHSHPQGGKP